MARRRSKRKLMTTTQKYNRVAIGLSYFGIELKTKKKATSKALKEAQKIWQKTRQELKEQGITELPTIVQAYKYVKEQETLPKVETELPTITPPTDEELEPLSYETGTGSMDNDYEYPVIEEFYQVIDDAIEAVNDIYGPTNVGTSLVNRLTHIRETVNRIRENMDDDILADWLSNSNEFDALKEVNYANYEETSDTVDALWASVDGLATKAGAEIPIVNRPTNTWTPPQHDINTSV